METGLEMLPLKLLTISMSLIKIPDMKEIGKISIEKEMENSIITLETIIKVMLKTIWDMEKEFIPIKMVINILEISKKMISVDTELSTSLTEMFILENSYKLNSTD